MPEIVIDDEHGEPAAQCLHLRQSLLSRCGFTGLETGGTQQHRRRATHAFIILHVQDEPASGGFGKSQRKHSSKLRGHGLPCEMSDGGSSGASVRLTFLRVNTDDSYRMQEARLYG